ncbi:MAG TPA: tRNA pseudouridine(13) synthase TruD [Planctomicrobium sp.]|nr:tRNA pseudouridine(13) synthase TruD [Planctomicrobium sp.]
MKLRRNPEDFEVIEKCTLPVGNSGSFAVYELQKRGWTTLDALDRLARQFGLPRKNIQHAGMKDRHAVTTQRITIRNGPRRSYGDDSLTLTYLGQSTREISADDLSGNAFRLVLRALTEEEQRRAETTLPEIQQAGIPNYFDDQRFGSWFPDHGFIAAAWIREDYEKALHLTFAEHEPLDDAEEREQKEILRDHWGNWMECKQLLSRSHRRSIVTYLCDHPTDFKRAWECVNGDLRGLFLSALQSDIWNQIVSDRFQNVCPADQLTTFSLRTGPVRVPVQLDPEIKSRLWKEHCPLPSGRLQLEDFPDPQQTEQTLTRLGWKLRDLKVKFPRDRFFSRSRRPVMIPVSDLSGDFASDELDAGGRNRLTLRFTLPRGAYATMVVKRLLLDEQQEASNDF